MIHRILCSNSEIAAAYANCLKSKIPFIAGSSSLYIPKTRTKLVNRDAVLPWPNLDGEVVQMTRGEAAKVELDRAFPGLKRVGWPAGHISLFDKLPPMMYSGPATFDGFYVDLKGAYFTIYRRLWLDTCYPRGMGSKPMRPVADRVAVSKVVRNAVIGVVRSRYVTMGNKKGQIIQVKSRNKYLSPGLWGTIIDILQDLANLAVKAGAVYIATDGYLFPEQSQVDEFIAQLEDWGFLLHIARGTIDIKAWGIYQVSDFKECARYRSFAGTVATQFSNLYQTDRSMVEWFTKLKS